MIQESRRSFLGALSATSLVGVARTASGGTVTAVAAAFPDEPSPAVVEHALSEVGDVYGRKLAGHAPRASDFHRIASAVSLLGDHLEETGANRALETYVLRHAPETLSLDESDLQRMCRLLEQRGIEVRPDDLPSTLRAVHASRDELARAAGIGIRQSLKPVAEWARSRGRALDGEVDKLPRTAVAAGDGWDVLCRGLTLLVALWGFGCGMGVAVACPVAALLGLVLGLLVWGGLCEV